MTAPVSSTETQVALDGSTEAASQDEALDLGKVKLEGEQVPEALRGKTAADAIKMVTGFQEALKISEEARLRADQQFQLAMRAAPMPLPAAAPKEEEYTEEQITELLQTDQRKAIEYLSARAARVAERNLEARFGPMLHGSVSALEAQVKQQYADEFALFGDQIEGMIETLPGKRANMVTPQAWDDLISLIRGRRGNIDKFITQQNSKAAEKARAEAQKAEVAASGFIATTAIRGATAPIPGSVAQLDATQLEICDRLGITPEDYVKWSKV